MPGFMPGIHDFFAAKLKSGRGLFRPWRSFCDQSRLIHVCGEISY
jgi:hypothetical protein